MTPVIFGLEGSKLSAREKGFFKEADPAGIILFTRNIENPDQVHGLTDAVRDVLGRDLLVLIDQEGGRVQRLCPPHWRTAPPMSLFGRAYEKCPEKAARALYLNCRLLAHDLGDLGINVDCLPVLDIPGEDADDVIGDRAFSRSPEVVTALGNIACQGLLDGLVLPIIKHIPGHGRAAVDSHKALPVVKTPRNELAASDFVPFKGNEWAQLAMTAHVTYKSIDPENPATLSKTVISDIIRGDIGFKGVLISDDINMKALSGSLSEITSRCLEAGINLVLHCSGRMAEMEEVMAGSRPIALETDLAVGHALSGLEGLIDDTYDHYREYKALEAELERLVA